MEHGNVGSLQALQHVLRFHTLQAVMHRIVSYTPHCLNYTYCISGSSYSHTSQLAAALSVQSSVPEHISTQTSIIHEKYTKHVLYSAFVKLAPEAQMGLRSHMTGRGPTVALPWLFLDLFRPLVHFGVLSTHGRSQAQAFPHAP